MPPRAHIRAYTRQAVNELPGLDKPWSEKSPGRPHNQGPPYLTDGETEVPPAEGTVGPCYVDACALALPPGTRAG